MLKSLTFSAFVAVALAAGAALAVEPATMTPPMAKSGMFVNAKGMTL
jgi:predicted lipoprotein with Yx(FWY)xxD motif